MRKWFGDSIGRWEGDTLVIETTNFHPEHGFRDSWENLKVTERLSRKDAEHDQLPLHGRGSDDVHGAVHRRAGVQRDGAGRDGLRVRVPRSQLRPRRRDERRARAGSGGGEEEAVGVPSHPCEACRIERPAVDRTGSGRPRFIPERRGARAGRVRVRRRDAARRSRGRRSRRLRRLCASDRCAVIVDGRRHATRRGGAEHAGPDLHRSASQLHRPRGRGRPAGHAPALGGRRGLLLPSRPHLRRGVRRRDHRDQCRRRGHLQVPARPAPGCRRSRSSSRAETSSISSAGE